MFAYMQELIIYYGAKTFMIPNSFPASQRHCQHSQRPNRDGSPVELVSGDPSQQKH
jgi:hypothetical protein